MVQHVTLDEAQAQLDQLIDAAVSGATILITKNGDRTVQLVPVDFGEPLDDFAEYSQ